LEGVIALSSTVSGRKTSKRKTLGQKGRRQKGRKKVIPVKTFPSIPSSLNFCYYSFFFLAFFLSALRSPFDDLLVKGVENQEDSAPVVQKLEAFEPIEGMVNANLNPGLLQ